MKTHYFGVDNHPELQEFRFFAIFDTDNGWREEIDLTDAEASDFERVRSEWTAWQDRLLAAKRAAEDELDSWIKAKS